MYQLPNRIKISFVTTPADKTGMAYFIYIQDVLYDLSERGHQEMYNAPYAVCFHCGKILKYHITFKCPFEPTDFAHTYDLTQEK